MWENSLKAFNELMALVSGRDKEWNDKLNSVVSKSNEKIKELEEWRNNLVYTRYIKETYLPSFSCGTHRLVKLGTITGNKGAGFIFEAVSGCGYNARVNQQRIVRMHVRFSNNDSNDQNISATMHTEGQSNCGFAHKDAIFIVNEDLTREAKASNLWGVYVWVYGCTGQGRLFVKEAGGTFKQELRDISGSLEEADIDIIKSHLPFQANNNSFVYQPLRNLVLNGQTIV